MASSGNRFYRLVLVPLPYQGHINPMLQLATALHSRGFSITIVHTQFNCPNPSFHPYFTFEPIMDGLSDEVASSRDWMSIITTLNNNCEEPFRNCLAQLQEKNPHERILCIISDSNMYFAQTVANHMKLRGFVLWTHNAAFYLALQHGQGHVPLQDPSLQVLVKEVHNLIGRPQAKPNTESTTAPQKFSMFEVMKTSSGIILNTFDYLEQSALEEMLRIIPVPNFAIGPLQKLGLATVSSLVMEDKSCITWLDEQAAKSVIYVSFGSVTVMDEKDIVETAWGLANSEQPFLWVVRPGLVHGSEWIELLPEGFEEITSERGCIVKWAPQKDVLAHPSVGGFWTHCGWNSILESICEGVPMLCCPCFGDQMLNAKYVSHVWRVGLQLEKDFERTDIERAIRRIMVDKEGEEMRKLAMDIKEKADLCLRKGGSSYESLDKLVEIFLSF